MTNDILNIINKYSKLDKRYQIKYITPEDYIDLAKDLDEWLEVNNILIVGECDYGHTCNHKDDKAYKLHCCIKKT